MAKIYWNRIGHRALPEVKSLMRTFQHAPDTYGYWVVVKAFLEGCQIKPGKKH